MRLYYNIWREDQFEHINELLDELVELEFEGVNIVSAISLQGLMNFYPIEDVGGFVHRKDISTVINKAYKKGLKIILKPQVHIRDAGGLKPNWWSGWVGLLWNESDLDKFFNLYFREGLSPLFEYDNRNKIDGVIIGTELVSIVSDKRWQRAFNIIKQVQRPGFFITYAHIFWSPILTRRKGLLRWLRFWLGTDYIFNTLLTDKRWRIPKRFRILVADKLLNSGRVFCWDSLSTVGLSMFPYFVYDKKYKNIKKRFRDFVVEYTYKLFWWRIRSKIKIDYFDDILKWSRGKNLMITETGLQYFWDTVNDLEYQTKYWATLFDLFRDKVVSIGVWDDAPYQKSVLLESIKRALNNEI